jgi:hypothetical protein
MQASGPEQVETSGLGLLHQARETSREDFFLSLFVVLKWGRKQ